LELKPVGTMDVKTVQARDLTNKVYQGGNFITSVAARHLTRPSKPHNFTLGYVALVISKSKLEIVYLEFWSDL
jgi:hypothetical protein